MKPPLKPIDWDAVIKGIEALTHATTVEQVRCAFDFVDWPDLTNAEQVVAPRHGSDFWWEESPEHLSAAEVAEARERRLDMQHLQEMEGNPLDADDIAMFEMFERERWSHERRRAYILSRVERVRSGYGT